MWRSRAPSRLNSARGQGAHGVSNTIGQTNNQLVDQQASTHHSGSRPVARLCGPSHLLLCSARPLAPHACRRLWSLQSCAIRGNGCCGQADGWCASQARALGAVHRQRPPFEISQRQWQRFVLVQRQRGGAAGSRRHLDFKQPDLATIRRLAQRDARPTVPWDRRRRDRPCPSGTIKQVKATLSRRLAAECCKQVCTSTARRFWCARQSSQTPPTLLGLAVEVALMSWGADEARRSFPFVRPKSQLIIKRHVATCCKKVPLCSVLPRLALLSASSPRDVC